MGRRDEFKGLNWCGRRSTKKQQTELRWREVKSQIELMASAPKSKRHRWCSLNANV